MKRRPVLPFSPDDVPPVRRRKPLPATRQNRSRFRKLYRDIMEELNLTDDGLRQELGQVAVQILDICNRFGGNLDAEECNCAAWLAYYEACASYPACADCCDWDSYLTVHLEAAIQSLRQQRNLRITMESPFSLNQTTGTSQTQAIQWLHLPQGDFTRGVDLRDYLSRLPRPERELAGRFVRADTDWEIRRDWLMPPELFYHLKWELRTDMQSYLEI